MEILNKIELIFFTTKDGKKHSSNEKSTHSYKCDTIMTHTPEQSTRQSLSLCL